VADPTLTPALVDQLLARAMGQRADQVLRDRLLRRLLDSAVAGAERIAEDMSLAESLGPSHPVLQRLATDHAPKIVGINATTRERLKNGLLQAIADGESLPGQVAVVQEVFTNASRSRATTIARTENLIFWEAGGHQQMVEGGAVAHLWITTRDIRRRPSHVPMEGQCQPIHVPFVSGAGVRLMHPGDPSAPIEELANCRCLEVPLTRDCESRNLHFGSYQRRTIYWKGRIRAIEQAERLVLSTTRGIFAEQRADVLAAIEDLVGNA